MRVDLDDKAIDLWPVAVGILVVLLIVQWFRTRSLPYLFFFIVFGVYLLSALGIVFFPLHSTSFYADAMRDVPFMSFVNLIPFYFDPYPIQYGSLEMELLLRNSVQNIILTVPFGFGVSFISRLRAKDFLWLPVAVGLSIETTQLATSLAVGYPYRVIDVNDVILNALGVLIGYGIFRVFAWLYLWVTHRLRIRGGGLLAYIDEVARREQGAGKAMESVDTVAR